MTERSDHIDSIATISGLPWDCSLNKLQIKSIKLKIKPNTMEENNGVTNHHLSPQHELATQTQMIELQAIKDLI